MAFFRQYISPLIALLVFFAALVAVAARSFLPGDMAAPAPIEPVAVISQPTVSQLATSADQVAGLPPALARLVKGLPDSPVVEPF